jgi:type IV secretory pathway VirB10-like protein
VLLVWTRLIMPNGRSIVLERQQGADAGGYSGLEDDVDNHWAELFKAAMLSTILGVGPELGSGADTGSNTDIIQALRLSAANSLNQTGQQVVRRNLNIQPTLTIRPGFPVRVGNGATYPMTCRRFVPLLVNGSRRREHTVVQRARFSNEADSFLLMLGDKLNSLTHATYPY